MPNGKIHFATNLIALSAAGASAYLLDWPAAPTIGLLTGMGVATIITPDFDIENITRTERAALQIPILGDLFVASFYPYGLRFKHRGISHDWLLGTMTRVAYTALVLGFWWLWLVGIFTVMDRQAPTWAWSIQPVMFACFVLGWWLQDLTHIALDNLFGG